MKHVAKFLLVGILAIAFLAGCAKQPTQEINDTKAAVQSVITEQGDKYSPEETKKLNDDMAAMAAEVKVQDEKFFKNYDKAKGMLTKIKADADAVKAALPAKKEKAKQDAMAALEAAKTAAAEAKALLAKAPKGKGTTQDLEAMKADMAGIEESLPQIQAMIDSGDFFGALEKAKAVNEKAAAITAQVNEALAKKGVKKADKKAAAPKAEKKAAAPKAEHKAAAHKGHKAAEKK